jgi:N-acetyl-gamma-glutamyl-phosphate reductase
VVVVSALDNMLKGAGSQAIQNLNLMFGLEESAGIGGVRGS